MTGSEHADSSGSKTFASLTVEAADLERRIGSAPTRDEALELAIAAAELCMQALKIAANKFQRSDMTARCQSLLGEAERIKADAAWAPGENMIDLSPEKRVRTPASERNLIDLDFSPARGGAMTEDVLSKEHHPSVADARVDSDFVFSVEKRLTSPLGAQREASPQQGSSGSPTKSSTVNSSPVTAKVKQLREPKSSRLLSGAEQTLLSRSSRFNGIEFPSWKEEFVSKDFDLPNQSGNPFIDSQEIALAPEQLQCFQGWKRAVDALPPPSMRHGGSEACPPVMHPAAALDLVQDAGTDCSVVASLCALAARADRGYSNLLQSIIFPFDATNMRPRISQTGKYNFRLNFNGCYRKVTVDDRLPVSSSSRILHVVDRNNPSLLWPALLEKAYLKLRGGYGFPGSNSNTDLWIMTGWIPEQVFLESEETSADKLWKRILSAFRFGDVLITLGTGRMSARIERSVGLVGEHDYAVLDLKEEDDRRLVLVKNPWSQGTVASDSGQNTEHDSERSRSAPGSQFEGTGGSPGRSSSETVGNPAPGTWWMSFISAMNRFRFMYLNWNPGLFSYRQDFHFSWDLSTRKAAVTVAGSIVDSPQYCMSVKGEGIVWLLLSRHFKDPDESDDPFGTDAVNDLDLSGYIGLTVLEGGNRLYHIHGALLPGPLVQTPQTLLRLDVPVGPHSFIIVPTEQGLSSSEHVFTLSVFSTMAAKVSPAEALYAHQTSVRAAWTSSTSGGNSSSLTYATNPQFRLVVPQATPMALLLQTSNRELNIQVRLLHGQGRRLHTVTSRDTVADSGEYCADSALAQIAELDAGVYTIICSTFQANQVGDFVLKVDSAVKCELTLLPKEAAGRLARRLAIASFGPHTTKLAAPVIPRRLIRASVIANYVNPSQKQPATGRSPVRLSFELGRGPDRHILVASSGGEYSDSANGVRTDEVDLMPEMLRMADMWLVVDRLTGPLSGSEEHYAVELFTDVPDAVSVGVWRRWED